MKKLPKTPSKLLAIALTDLVKVERSKKYVVAMNTWHLANDPDRCQVCLAGAVMAKTLKADDQLTLEPDHFGINSEKLQAINYFRVGYIEQACAVLEIRNKLEADVISMPSYENSPQEFKKQMRKMIKTLAKVGM